MQKIQTAILATLTVAFAASTTILLVRDQSALAKTRGAALAIESVSNPAASASTSISLAGRTKPADHEFNKWDAIQNEDIVAYVQNLRQLGCPEPVIQDIILSEVSRRCTASWKAHLPLNADWNYWEPDALMNLTMTSDAETTALDKHLNLLANEALGLDPTQRHWRMSRSIRSVDRVGRDIAFLSPEKQELIRPMLEESARKEEHALNPQLVDESAVRRNTVDELDAVYEQRLEDLASVLTPEELEVYEYRTSNIAREVRNVFGNLKLTPEEFQTIYKIRKETYAQIKEARASYDPSKPIRSDALFVGTTGEMEAKVQALNDHAAEQIKALLGEERYNR